MTKGEMTELLDKTSKNYVKYCEKRIYAVHHSLFDILGEFENILATEMLNAYRQGLREGFRLAQSEVKKSMEKENGK